MNAADIPEFKGQMGYRLYTCSKEIIRRYTKALEPLGITYTQYLVLQCLWSAADSGNPSSP